MATGRQNSSFGAARDPGLDGARALAMLLVVYGHALEAFFTVNGGVPSDAQVFAVWRAIYGFHVPAFYLIAGMARAGLRQRSGGRVLSETVALILFAELVHAAGWGVQGLAALAFDRATAPSLLLGPMLQGHGLFIVVMWFVVSLALVQLFAWVLLGPVGWPVKALLLLLLVVVHLRLSGVDNVWTLRTAAPGLAFFLAGSMLARWRPPAWGWVLALPAAVWLVPFNHGCLLSYGRVCPDGYDQRFVTMLVRGREGFLPLFLLTGFLGAAGLLSLGRMLHRVRWLVWIGRRTLALLVINGVALSMIAPHLPRFGAPFAAALALLAAQLLALLLFAGPILAVWRGVLGGVERGGVWLSKLWFLLPAGSSRLSP